MFVFFPHLADIIWAAFHRQELPFSLEHPTLTEASNPKPQSGLHPINIQLISKSGQKSQKEKTHTSVFAF